MTQLSPSSSSVLPGADVPATVVLEEPQCPLGCADGDTKVAAGFDRMFAVPGRFFVLRCHRCGLMRTSPRPTLETIATYYPDRYAPYAAAAIESSPSAFGRLLMRLRLDGTRDLLPRMPPGQALEIGCASGTFMKKLRRRGWSVQGIEPSASAAGATADAGFLVHVGPVETAPDYGERFDLIVASHALEHLHQPLSVLRRLRSWARPGARLSLAVPNADSVLFQVFRGAWYDLDLPRHLFHFTPRTIAAILSAAGWETVRIRAQRTFNSAMGSLGNWLVDRGARWKTLGTAFLGFPDSASPLKRLTVPLAGGLSLLGQTGRMLILAKAARSWQPHDVDAQAGTTHPERPPPP